MDSIHHFVLQLDGGLELIVAAPLRGIGNGEMRFNRPPTSDEMEKIRCVLLPWRADTMQTVADLTGEAVADEIVFPDGTVQRVLYTPG